jgi:hypothetical protein
MVQEKRERVFLYQNTWSQVMGCILIGFFLCSFNLNVGIFTTIIGFVGRMFVLYGFHSVRKENEYFQWAWILSVLFFATYILAEIGVLISMIKADDFWKTAITIVHLCIVIGIMLLLQAGLHECEKDGLWPLYGLLCYEIFFLAIVIRGIKIDLFELFILLCIHTWLLLMLYLNIVKRQ